MPFDHSRGSRGQILLRLDGHMSGKSSDVGRKTAAIGAAQYGRGSVWSRELPPATSAQWLAQHLKMLS
ncbi:MAG: hypothetical protein ACI9HE_002904 [Planctomycetota bacterium]